MKTKRTYKHSEAWLEKHAAKAAKVGVKKNAKKTVKANKPAKMTAEEKAAKKEAKKAAMEAKKAERLAKKEAKKLAKEKKMAATSAKKANKAIMKQANKLFAATKKCVSATKKQTKAYGKLMTEALKNGDSAIVEKIVKLFGRLGYSKLVNGNTIENTFRVEIKLPKVKLAKVDKKEIDAPPKEQTQRTIVIEAQDPLNEDGTPATPLKKKVESSARDGGEAGPSDEELSNLENELEDDQPEVGEPVDGEEPTDGEEANDDIEEEEETDDSRDEPDMFESSTMRDRSDAFREMEEAQHENGEWEG